MTIKDFDYFADHKIFIDGNIDPLIGRALFSLRGQKWRGSYANSLKL
jgi:cytochrome P450 family 9